MKFNDETIFNHFLSKPRDFLIKSRSDRLVSPQRGPLFKTNNIHKKKFLYSDWLRAVQFFLKQRRKELIWCKKRIQTKHSDWAMIKETQRWPIKSFAFKSSARPGWRN